MFFLGLLWTSEECGEDSALQILRFLCIRWPGDWKCLTNQVLAENLQNLLRIYKNDDVLSAARTSGHNPPLGDILLRGWLRDSDTIPGTRKGRHHHGEGVEGRGIPGARGERQVLDRRRVSEQGRDLWWFGWRQRGCLQESKRRPGWACLSGEGKGLVRALWQ